MPTVISTTTHKAMSTATRTARKRHVCDSCLKPIAVGTTYERQFCVDGGDAWSYVAHIPCIAASQILWDSGIQGDEVSLINVCDMDYEDRELVFKISPETYRLAWPDRPDPSKPEMVLP